MITVESTIGSFSFRINTHFVFIFFDFGQAENRCYQQMIQIGWLVRITGWQSGMIWETLNKNSRTKVGCSPTSWWVVGWIGCSSTYAETNQKWFCQIFEKLNLRKAFALLGLSENNSRKIEGRWRSPRSINFCFYPTFQFNAAPSQYQFGGLDKWPPT